MAEHSEYTDLSKEELLKSLSEFKMKVSDLEKSDEFTWALLDSFPFGVDVVDSEGNILFMNKKHELELGQKVVGMKCWEVCKDDKKQCSQCPLKEGIELGHTATIETEGALGNRSFYITHTAIVYDGKKAILEVFQDITERKQVEKELQKLSFVDELTGLHNRRSFLELGEHRIKLAERNRQVLSLFYIDLDNMKWINDTIGHAEGDSALVDTANILKDTCRESDLVSRLGGDEFVILTTGLTEDSANLIAERLKNNVNNYNSTNSKPYGLSISVGMARRNPVDRYSINDLLNEADKVMYGHKSQKSK